MGKNEFLMSCIRNEILAQNGLGFKVELPPIRIKFETYEKQFCATSENPNGYIWVLSSLRRVGTIIPLAKRWRSCYCSEIDMDDLPQGITIEKDAPCLLCDERTEELHYRRKGKYLAAYLEGQRVFLTVSNEYASRIFKEVYANIGIPFRDRLLSKHQDILNGIVEYLGTSTYEENDFTVYKGSVDCSFHSDPYYFKDVYMKPLSSIGQMYGMALALIETLKEYDFEWNNYLYTISEEDCCIRVDYSRSEELAEQNLKEW